MGASARAPSRRGSQNTTPRSPNAASRGPSRPPCSGAHLCARGNAEQQPQRLFAGAPRCAPGVFGTPAHGSSGKAASPGPPPRPHARRPPCAPSPGVLTEKVMCGRVGRRSGGRSAHKNRTTRQTRSPANQSTAAPGATGNLARVQRLQGPAAQARGNIARTHALAHRPMLPGLAAAAQEKNHVRAGPSPAALGPWNR